MEKNELLKNEEEKVKRILKAIKEEIDIYVIIDKNDSELRNKLDFNEIIITNEEIENGYKEYLKGAKVIIMYRNNEKEKLIAKEIKEKLKYYVYAKKMILMSDIEETNIKQLKHEINKKIWEYAEWINREELSNGKIKEKIIEGILHYAIMETLSLQVIGEIGKRERRIYMYDNGLYNEISYYTLKSYVKRYIPMHLLTDKILSNITNLLIPDEIYDSSIFIEEENIINVQNGLYNVLTEKLERHRPDYISNKQFKVNFNENPVNNGYWDKYIDTLIMGDIELKDILQELIGLILSNYNGTLPKKIFILNGKKDTGKSKIIKILNEILGNERNESIALQRLGDKFSLGNISGKRLISLGEISNETIDTDAIEYIKLLTGGDEVPVEQKFNPKMDVDYRGVLLYCGNNLPNLKSTEVEAILSRIMIIPCNNKPIPANEQDPQILKKLLEDKEYIFRWGLIGLNRLIKNKFKFSYSKRVESAIDKYTKDVDSVGHFIDRNFLITGNRKDKIRTSELYNSYVKWCSQNIYYAHNKMNFKIRICAKGVIYNAKYQGNPYYEGLILKKDENV
ncbi:MULTISPECIES: phage/plasmid primase, P4 family [unclassified Clostridium]|uniref:DNA primase family protein n=1 Tax=unclassified Clostridium TaxID=2614128 RepID=UPI000297CE2E|nr:MULTISPECIES: phage/plasmid primase, P4 family [unclassified Clostridium]EKQ51780.1 MAG: phage/plasmid primase, P4 family [Clostridium sp. Maddingley MBC34-26]